MPTMSNNFYKVDKIYILTDIYVVLQPGSGWFGRVSAQIRT